MGDLCTACLCTGRKLFFIGETGCYHLYSQILNEINVYDFSDVSIKVCFDCKSLLRRFEAFKVLVKNSYSDLLLLTQLHQNSPSSKLTLERPPRLKRQSIYVCSYPELFQPIKEEVDEAFLMPVQDVDSRSVKVEFEPPHSEPEAEAFVEDVEVTKTKTKKNNKKTHKEKSNKKTKMKVKRLLVMKKIKAKKKAEEVHSVSSGDPKLLMCEALEDTGINDDDFDDDEDLSLDAVKKGEQLKEQKKKEHSRSKSKKTDIENNEDIVLEKERPPAIVKYAREKNPEPEAVGDKVKCPECGKFFSSKKTYRYHFRVLHRGQNRHPCLRCDKVFQWKSNLGRHMRSHKAQEAGELYCEPCDKRFASIATYRQHLSLARQHVSETEYNFMCNDCGKKFGTKTRLRDHVDWEHLQKVKYRCELCDNKPFKSHTSLYLHMQNYHINTKKENLCHICGKSYLSPAKLKYHIVALHTSQTPYQCSQCAASFGWYSSLYRHVREVHYKIQSKRIRKLKRTNPPPHL